MKKVLIAGALLLIVGLPLVTFYAFNNVHQVQEVQVETVSKKEESSSSTTVALHSSAAKSETGVSSSAESVSFASAPASQEQAFTDKQPTVLAVQEVLENPYQSIFERMGQYQALGRSRDFSAFDSLMEGQSEEEWLLARSLFDTAEADWLQYVYNDVNHDGQAELLLGTPQHFAALYYLDGQTPRILAGAGVASAGGQRKSLEILEDGTIVTSQWQSTQPDGRARIYAWSGSQPLQLAEQVVQVASDGSLLNQLGLTAPVLNPSSLPWQPLP